MQPGSKLNFDIDDFLKLMKTMKAMKIKKWNQHEVDIDLKEEWLEKLNSIPNVKLINICSGHEVESITALGGDNYPGVVFRLVSDNKNIDKFKDKSLEINDQLNKLKETWAEVSWFIYSGKIINQDLSKSRYYKCFIGKTELPDNVIINGRGDIINGTINDIDWRIKSEINNTKMNITKLNHWWEMLITEVASIFSNISSI